MSYASVEQVKSYLRIPVDDTDDDVLLAICLASASAAIDRTCNTTFEDPYPDSVTLACLMQAARFFKRREAPFGVAGSPEMGSEMRLLAQLDPDVKVLLANVRSMWGAV